MRTLIVVDMQNDFMPGGRLEVVKTPNVGSECSYLACRPEYGLVVLTQDWHPHDHLSFASQWGQHPFSTKEMVYGTQVLWPDHCIQGTPGAELSPYLSASRAQLIIRKGCDRQYDSYSAFEDAGGRTTGLAGYLTARGVSEIDVCGLALDYCVAYTALDARKLGFQVRVLKRACGAIDRDHSLANAIVRMSKAGVRIE